MGARQPRYSRSFYVGAPPLLRVRALLFLFFFLLPPRLMPRVVRLCQRLSSQRTASPSRVYEAEYAVLFVSWAEGCQAWGGGEMGGGDGMAG